MYCKILLISGLLFCCASVKAQFAGGNGQGTILTNSASSLALGTSIFKGGVDDGTVLVAPATSQPLGTSFFKGGVDDGTVLAAPATAQPLGTSFFKGGVDDGTVLVAPATAQPLGSSFFRGGVDDGTVLVAPPTAQPLGNSFFKGGADDGFAMAFAANVLLPVTLVSFDAAWSSENVITKWVTSSELNTAYFEVQRSTDGNNFHTIGRVTASGNSSTTKNYTFTDFDLKSQLSPLPTKLYYRLKIVDADGRFQYSAIVVLLTQGGNTIVYTLYPNPANKQLVIESKGRTANKYDIRVLAANGQAVLQKTMSSQRETLDVAALPSGIYFLSITEPDNKTTQTFKIIIQH